MKKVVCFLSIVLLGLLAGCGSKTEAKLQEGTRVYSLRDSTETVKPTITLEDDGQFTFVFSALSSYIGRGSYAIEDSRLRLETEDGNFHYAFDMTGQGLVFLAGQSSENTWYAEISDGAVFSPAP